MKKKIPQSAAPKKLSRSSISKAALVASMRRLSSHDDFKILLGRWLDIRSGILEDGKAKPSEGQWQVLKGFDLAIMEPDKWAGMELEDDHERRAAALQELLGDKL